MHRRSGSRNSVPNLQSALELGWVTQFPPAGGRNSSIPLGLFPGAAVADASGLGEEAGQANMDPDPLRATSEATSSHLQWLFGTGHWASSQLQLQENCVKSCAVETGHTHFINHYYIIASSISH